MDERQTEGPLLTIRTTGADTAGSSGKPAVHDVATDLPSEAAQRVRHFGSDPDPRSGTPVVREQFDDDRRPASTTVTPHVTPQVAAADQPMDFVTILVLAVRRWYLTVLGIGLTTAVAIFVATSVEPTYEASGSFLLSSPGLRGQDDTEGLASTVADGRVIAESVMAAHAWRSVVPQGVDATYFVEPTADGRILHISASADDPEVAIVVADNVIDTIAQDLADRQQNAGVPLRSQRTIKTLETAHAVQTASMNETAGGDSGFTVETEYSALASVLIHEPLEPGDNPYASSSLTLRVLEEMLMAPAMRAELLAGTWSASYQVAQRSRDTAPILYVTAEGTKRRQVEALFDRVATELADQLESRQETARIPRIRQVTFEPLAPPLGAVLTSNNLMRPLATVVGLGGVVTVVMLVLGDRLLARRRR